MAFAPDGGCLILDDDELEAAGKRVEWRKECVFEVRSLFRTVATPPQFQMTRKFPAPRGGSSADKFPFQRLSQTENIEKKIARPAGQPVASQEFKSLMEVDWNPTPEEIAEFGVPLLPLPPPWMPPTELRPLPLPIGEGGMPEEDLDESIYYFEDGDPRYAACTPPPLRVGEEESATPAVDTKDVVGLGPDVNGVIWNRCQRD